MTPTTHRETAPTLTATEWLALTLPRLWRRFLAFQRTQIALQERMLLGHLSATRPEVGHRR